VSFSRNVWFREDLETRTVAAEFAAGECPHVLQWGYNSDVASGGQRGHSDASDERPQGLPALPLCGPPPCAGHVSHAGPGESVTISAYRVMQVSVTSVMQE